MHTQSARKSERARGRRTHLRDREQDWEREGDNKNLSHILFRVHKESEGERGERERGKRREGGRERKRKGGREGMREGGEEGAEMLAHSHTHVHVRACTLAHVRTLYLRMPPPRVIVNRYERGDVSTPG